MHNARTTRRLSAKGTVRLLAKAAVFFSIFTVVGTLLLRFTPPITSGLMMERRVGSWFSPEPYQRHYDWQPLEHIAPVMGVAVIAAEDQLFADHFGFDWRAIEKAISYNQKHHKTRGASTISQQTAKNLFLWSGRSWLRKGLEAYFTVLIECLWSKERILEVYLNIVELGDGVYGVEAAAQMYFHKPAARLTASEAALLAAVLPNPLVYQVNKPSRYIRGRQAWIVRNIKRLGGSAYLNKLDD